MNFVDGPKAIRHGEELNIHKVGAFLRKKLPGIPGQITIKQFPGGFSNLTYLIQAGDREWVLRRPPFGKKAKSAHDMSREFKILKALHPVFPACPEPLVYGDDPDVMGCDFYIMTAIRGIILRKKLPDGFELSPESARRLCENTIDLLYRLHNVDHNGLGLDHFGKPEGYVRRQVDGWCERYRDARTDDAPDFETVMRWLQDHMPAETDRPCIIHNDFKFDNLVLNPSNPIEIIGLLDWEMATLGDPLMDLGATLGYWVEAKDPQEMHMIRTLPTVYPGMMTRREVVETYLARSKRSLPDGFHFYYVFGTFRLAVIAQQIYYRFFHGQTQDSRFGLLIAAVQVLERTAQRAIASSRF